MTIVQIIPVTKRIWFTHPMYWRARANMWNCWRWWRPYLIWTTGYRYYIDGVEVNQYGEPL